LKIQTFLCRVNPRGGIWGFFLGEISLSFYKEIGNYLELFFPNINLTNFSFFGLNFAKFLYERIFFINIGWEHPH
jgi:hypothetical protein